MGVTRRRFLARLATAGGASLVYEGMTGLGLLATPAQAPFGLSGQVPGVRVAILGADLDFRGTMRERPPAEIQRLALEHGARIHPQYPNEFESAFSVSWARVPWNRGSWRSESDAAPEALSPLRQPDGRVHFAGDYMTDMSSWMQGAFESGRDAATALHSRVMAKR